MRFLRWTQRVLFACGISALAYCCFALVDSWVFQKTERRQFELLLTDHLAKKKAPPATIEGLIGRIEIPRLGVSTIIMEGTSATTLRRAVGHIAGTALPGQPGNVGLSGHRDTFFRPLCNIKQNDIITLTTLLGEYRYRVVSTKIVSPNDVSVLDPSVNGILTLVTCYPFYFVGSAPDRFIVRAESVT
jgi:sortase A